MNKFKVLLGINHMMISLISFSIIWIILDSFVFPSKCLIDRWAWSNNVQDLFKDLSVGLLVGALIYWITSVLPAKRQRQTVEPIICSIWDKAISEHEKIMSEIRYLEEKYNKGNEFGVDEKLPDKAKITRVLERIPADALTNSVYYDGSHRRFYPFVNHRLSFVSKYIRSKSGVRAYMTAEENTVVEHFLNLSFLKDHSVDDPNPYDWVDNCSCLVQDFDDYITVMKQIYEYRSGQK